MTDLESTIIYIVNRYKDPVYSKDFVEHTVKIINSIEIVKLKSMVDKGLSEASIIWQVRNFCNDIQNENIKPEEYIVNYLNKFEIAGRNNVTLNLSREDIQFQNLPSPARYCGQFAPVPAYVAGVASGVMGIVAYINAYDEEKKKTYWTFPTLMVCSGVIFFFSVLLVLYFHFGTRYRYAWDSVNKDINLIIELAKARIKLTDDIRKIKIGINSNDSIVKYARSYNNHITNEASPHITIINKFFVRLKSFDNFNSIKIPNISLGNPVDDGLDFPWTYVGAIENIFRKYENHELDHELDHFNNTALV